MIIETLSTFPQMFDSVMNTSMMRIAQEKGALDFTAYDLRDWTHDRHRTTDDDPYGGGAGLIMKCAPIFEAYQDITGFDCGLGSVEPTGNEQPRTGPLPKHATQGQQVSASHGSSQGSVESGHQETVRTCPQVKTVFLTPCGRRFDDALAREMAGEERLLFICGHYEGIDERAYALADYQVSLGDYVLTSGELAAMVVIDAVVRKLPGVLGAEGGAEDESFAQGLLEYPQYTRPAEFLGMRVPDVLLSGDHGAVDRWRYEQSLERTKRLRPDLLPPSSLD